MAEEERSEEELIEEAVRRYLFLPPRDRREEGRRPWPRYPLYGSGGPTLTERVDYQGTMGRLLNNSESYQVRKVASLLAEALSRVLDFA